MFGRSPNGASVNRQKVDKSSLDKYRGFWDQINPIAEVDEDIRAELSKVEAYAIYSPQTEFLRGRRVVPHDTPPIGLHGEGLPDAVRGLVRNAKKLRGKALEASDDLSMAAEFDIVERSLNLTFAPGWAKLVSAGKIKETLTSRDVATSSYDTVYFVDKFMKSSRNALSAYDSSEGSLFLLFAAILVGHPDSPQIFAFDNVDSALNPKLTRALLEHLIYCTNAVQNNHLDRGPEQVFLTTHNPTSLDAFDIFDDNHRIFVVKRSVKGSTLVERLAPPPGMTRQEWVIASSGRELSQLWIGGEIDGALGI
ncbi:AAA family ATPase [Paracoccus yeei]|uniref:AAA family ATPase n=1 Tax=Paracoccus yeei TaxID=147645 RepID=UPI0012DBE7CF|nr:AAA family ATPase [Paracoccus yeei]